MSEIRSSTPEPIMENPRLTATSSLGPATTENSSIPRIWKKKKKKNVMSQW